MVWLYEMWYLNDAKMLIKNKWNMILRESLFKKINHTWIKIVNIFLCLNNLELLF